MARMDASQEVSLDPTTAPSPDFDFSSHQFTTNSGGDGFSPARPGPPRPQFMPIGSTSRPCPSRPPIRPFKPAYAACSRAGRWPFPARHIRAWKESDRANRAALRQPTAEDVQQYLNRLRDFDFRTFSIERKQAVAKMVNRLFDAGALDVLISDPKQDGRLTRITRMRCYATNERSKGSFQARIGSTTVYTGKSWPDLIVQDRDHMLRRIRTRRR